MRFMGPRPLLLVLALVAQPMAVSHARPVAVAAADRDIVLYRIVKGDNLYTLAERYFFRVTDFRIVQKLNRITDPYHVPVGRILRIPRQLLRYEMLQARVLAFRGPVRVHRADGDVPVAMGMQVGEGDEIATAANGFVSLGLPDRSVVALPSQSRVAVRRLRRLLLTGGVERLFAIDSGRARAIVTPMKRQQDDFRFSTPAAVSAVRGTEYRMTYRDDRTTTEVLHGVVDVVSNADGAIHKIAAGFGAVSSATGTDAAVPLLPPPELEHPGTLQDEEDLSFTLQPLSGARSYHAQVAQDAGFIDTLSETLTPELGFSLPSVPDGTWFVRVSGIDANGLEGIPATFSFERRRAYIKTAMETRRVGGDREYLFRWMMAGAANRTYRFLLSSDAEGAIPMFDEAGLADEQFVVTNLPPGSYHWRVMSLEFVDGVARQQWSPVERLTVSANE